MWRLILFIPILFGLAISGLFIFLSVHVFQSIQYTYAGESIVTLEQYNEMKEYSSDHSVLKIVNIDNNELKVIYQFDTSDKLSYLTVVKENKPFWIGLWVMVTGVGLFILTIVGIKDLVRSIRVILEKRMG